MKITILSPGGQGCRVCGATSKVDKIHYCEACERRSKDAVFLMEVHTSSVVYMQPTGVVWELTNAEVSERLPNVDISHRFILVPKTLVKRLKLIEADKNTPAAEQAE